MTEHPRPLTAQRHTIPRQVEAAVLTALEKLPADRFASAAEFAAALTDTSYARAATTATAAMPAVGRPGATSWQLWFIAAAGVAVLATALAAWGWVRARALASQPALWQYIVVGDSVHPLVPMPSLALSPDGTTLVVKDIVQDGLLWAKGGSTLDPVPIPGTERALHPVFSPDGEWVAFVADQQLRKISPAGGSAVTLADSAAAFGGGVAWLDDGSLIYVQNSLNKLMRVSSSGGKGVVALDNSELPGQSLDYPTALPDSRGVLFLACGPNCVTASLRVLDLRTGQQKLVVTEAIQGWYLPTGHLLYTRRDGTALAAPFDLDRLEVTGPAVQVLDRVLVRGGFAQLAWSRSGVLVFERGEGAANQNLPVRVTPDGSVAPIDTSWYGNFASLAASPDGQRMAIGAGTGAGGLNIWVKQLNRGPFTRLSFGGGDRRPVWAPDGRIVAFIRDTLNTSVVAARFSDGSRPDTVLVHLDRQLQEFDWSRDGRWLVVRTDNSVAGAGDIVGLQTSGDTTPVPLLASRFTEKNPAVSPNSRWLAYVSNESGRDEVYVRPFPNAADGRWQISTAGGIQPRWAPDGRTLYYLDLTSRMIAVGVTTGARFAVGESKPLFDASGFTLDPFHQSYDLTPDGRSFLFLAPRRLSDAARTPSLVRVDHWFNDIRAKLVQ
ncbi:MAG: hypothetical protein E4H38_04725 [Gemmatimonadales bacterium]|nr:MAG: hypothetical protein E4H38_04725 [Gemmatimonadales bacterium]